MSKMIKCCRCGKEKSEEEFRIRSSSSTGRQSACKECAKAYDKQWLKEHPKKSKKWIARANERRRETRIWFNEYKKTLRCCICGESHPGVLDFHHKDPIEKDKTVSDAVVQWGRERILKEVAKCDILCANCHRKLHYEE